MWCVLSTCVCVCVCARVCVCVVCVCIDLVWFGQTQHTFKDQTGLLATS